MSGRAASACPAPPKKKRRWLRRTVVIGSAALLLLSFVGCAVYLTLSPSDAIDHSHSFGFRVGVRSGPGADAGAEDPQEGAWYDTPEESMRADGWYDANCVFTSEPLAVEETDDSIAILYFFDLGHDDKLEFNVVRMAKQDGRYSAPRKYGTYAYTDTGAESHGKWLYKTPEAKAAYYIIERIGDNLPPDPVKGFNYFGVSEDAGVKDMKVLGIRPTGVIPYAYEGQTYYFWYYEGLDVVGYLLSRDDFSLGGFTPRELIDVLGIEAPG